MTNLREKIERIIRDNYCVPVSNESNTTYSGLRLVAKEYDKYINAMLDEIMPVILEEMREKAETMKVKVERGSKKYGGYRVRGIVFADMKRARCYKEGFNQALLALTNQDNK